MVRGTTSIFTRDISAGGNQYTDLLQKELNLTFEQAESIKRGGTVEQQLTAEQIEPTLQSVSEMLALEIQRTLDFFRATAVDSPTIDRMLIAGGSSKVHQLAEYLSDKFQMPVEQFDSFRSIKFDPRKFDDEYLRELSPNMAVAVGLAVRVAEVSQ
jgi:type IV pilus assembly protein PilM